MNLPNQLTLARFGLTLVFLAIIFSGIPYHETVALLVFGLAGLTDHLDGRIARRDKLITNFGILMDPLADKILTCTAFISFVGLKLMPAWMAIAIVARELAITGLRLLAASKNVVLAAEGFGKHKTVSQIVAIIAVLIMISYAQWGAPGRLVFGGHLWGRPWVGWVAEGALWLSVALTIYSGLYYLWRNREIYLSDM